MGINVAQDSVPDCNVIFFPYVKEITYDQATAKNIVQPGTADAIKVATVSAQRDVIQCATSKGKGGTGTFSVLLSSRVNYKALLEAGAWCMIFISSKHLTGDESNGPDTGFKMLGQVKSVRRKEQIVNGVKTVRFLVSGEDFQCLLNAPVYLNAELSQDQKGKGTFTYSDLLLSLNLKSPVHPDKLVTTLLENLLGSTGFTASNANSFLKKPILASGRLGIPIKVPSEVSNKILGFTVTENAFTALLTLFFQKDLTGLSSFTNTISGQVPVWDLLASYCHRALNEIYTELIPVSVNGTIRLVPSIVLRPQPFNSQAVKKAPGVNPRNVLATLDASGKTGSIQVAKRRNNKAITTTNRLASQAHFYVSKKVKDFEIMAVDTGKSDKELHNFILFTPNTGSAVDPLTDVAILKMVSSTGIASVSDQVSQGRHGQRPFILFSNFILFQNETVSANKILRDMWLNAHLFESGSVSLVGQTTYIPVGTNIEFSDRGWIGHIERVDHIFNVDEGTGSKSFRTNIAFVRLQNFDGTPIDPVDHSTFEKGQVASWDRGLGGI